MWEIIIQSIGYEKLREIFLKSVLYKVVSTSLSLENGNKFDLENIL